MPVPLIRYDRSFFLTSKHLPDGLKSALQHTVARLAADWPALPGPNDDETRLGPSLVVWLRRRVGASPWWVHYSVTGEGIIVRSVNVL